MLEARKAHIESVSAAEFNNALTVARVASQSFENQSALHIAGMRKRAGIESRFLRNAQPAIARKVKLGLPNLFYAGVSIAKTLE